MTPLARAARFYTRVLAWPVFPVRSHAKAPPLVEAWPERATSDPDIIAGWWATWPNANIGLHCAGLLVLDVDGRKCGRAALDSLISQHCRLPPTAVSLTPNGIHILFRCPARLSNSAGQLSVGLDVRSTGGYVVLPPSTRPDGGYRWAEGRTPHLHGIADAPQWLVRLLTPPDKPQARAPAPPLTETSDRLIRFALARDLESVRTAREGERNHTLYAKARALARFGIDRTDLARDLINAAVAAGLPEAAAATVNSAFKSRSAA
jgi:Bifunctional DNA primase/polymerase, N-terminal